LKPNHNKKEVRQENVALLQREEKIKIKLNIQRQAIIANTAVVTIQKTTAQSSYEHD